MAAEIELGPLRVRPAIRDDLDALAALRPYVHDQHVTAHPEFFKPITPDAARREANAWLGRENSHVLLAEVEGEVIGYVYSYVASRTEGDSVRARRVLYVDQIAVNASHRGHGYGTDLLDAVCDLARRLGIDILELDVWDFNAGAQRFFVREGFVPMRQRLTRTLT